jgi:hypothetical protein
VEKRVPARAGHLHERAGLSGVHAAIAAR